MTGRMQAMAEMLGGRQAEMSGRSRSGSTAWRIA